MQPKIDIVYTWVNDNDSEFIKQLRQHATSEGENTAQRFRDIHNTLKYSLRSIEKYAPWINKIHLVAQRPQRPEWLNHEHPKIQLVYHDEFIPGEFLPTYNPRVIQSFFHLIPKSSDYLIYFNDDYLLGNEIIPDDFLSPKGRLKVYGSIMGIPLKFRVYAQRNQIKGLPRLEHSPFIIYKPYWVEMLNLKPTELDATRRSRFRDSNNLRMDRLYRYYLLSRERKNIDIVNAYQLLKISQFHRITDDFSEQKSLIETIKKKTPKFLCLNDNQSESPNKETTQLMIEFLEEQYPTPSSFEVQN